MTEGLKELGRRLQTCRAQAGLSPEELAERSRLQAERIVRFERGDGGLSVAELARAARVLGVPAATFSHTRAAPSRAYREPTVFLRALRQGYLRDQDLDAIARLNERARAFAEVGELLRVETLADAFVPSAPPNERPYDHGYRIARDARGRLPEREGPLTNVRRLIENRFNILVVEHAFADRTILGAACRAGPARLIVLSTSVTARAQVRFILTHELGHHLMDLEIESANLDEGGADEPSWWLENPPREKRANAFAAMFLAPDFAVRRYLGEPRPEGYGLEDAENLVSRASGQFGVSFAAMAWHLYNLKYFHDDATVKALLTGFRPADVREELEEPVRFDGLERRVFEALGRDLVSEAKARELLGGPLPAVEA